MTLAEVDLCEVWIALGGAPLKGKRGIAFWRGGKNRSVRVDRAKGWYDHANGVGGGALDLVRTVLACDIHAALEFLETNCGLDSRTRLSDSENRARQRERAARLREADDAESFARAVSALVEIVLEEFDPLDSSRFIFVELMTTIRRGGDGLLEELKAWRENSPELTEALIRTGAKARGRMQRRLDIFLDQESQHASS